MSNLRRMLLTCLGAPLVLGASACGPLGLAEDPLVGCYRPSAQSSLISGTIQVSSSGTLAHDMNGDTGTWKSQGGGRYALTWASNYVDSATLAGNDLTVTS